jgi:hypothetical protein
MKPFKFNSPEVIKRKIWAVANQLSPTFDGEILAAIMKMIYYHGVKIEEFQIMEIGYVVAGGKILNRFDSIYPPYLSLHNDYKILIQCHIDYLMENNYSLKVAAPLFPKIKSNVKKDESSAYQDYEIARHLKEHAGITWEQLRRDMVYHHYLLLIWQGYSNQDIINLTAWYFREDKKKIHTILKQGGITLSDVNLAPVIDSPKMEAAPIETKPQVQGQIIRPRHTDYSSELERLERRFNQMINREQKEDYDEEDGTDFSDPYFFGDDDD